MLGLQLRKVHNMDLKSYTNQLPHGGSIDFAKKLGITAVYLSQLASRQDDRLPSPSLCVRIEAESSKAVTRPELRPDDWHLIWPELIGADGSPPVPEASAKAA